MAAPTVLELITDAFGEIGVLASGAVPDSNQQAYALRRLNDFLDQLKVEDLTLSYVKRVPFDITPSQQDYSIGDEAESGLINGGFEGETYTPAGGLSTIPTGWIAGDAGIIQVATSPVHGGAQSMRIFGSSTGAGQAYQEIDALPSRVYSFDLWAESVLPGAPAAALRIQSFPSGKYLKNDGTWTASVTARSSTVVTTAFVEFTGTFTTETTTTSLRFECVTAGGAADSAYFDDASLGLVSTIDAPRPPSSDGLLVNYQDTTLDNPVEIPLGMLTDGQWTALSIKTLEATLPVQAYYNPTFPRGTLSLWPIPTQADLEGVLYIPVPISEVTSAYDTLVLPPAWRRMLVKNLAIELAPAFQRDVTPLLMRQAKQALTVLKASNIRPQDLVFPPEALIGSSRGRFNIYTGESD